MRRFRSMVTQLTCCFDVIMSEPGQLVKVICNAFVHLIWTGIKTRSFVALFDLEITPLKTNAFIASAHTGLLGLQA